MSVEHQPYRQGPRAPGPALDAMRAGRATPAPGAALMQGVARSSATPQATGARKGVRIPRSSAPSRTVRAQWPVKTQP